MVLYLHYGSTALRLKCLISAPKFFQVGSHLGFEFPWHTSESMLKYWLSSFHSVGIEKYL